MLVDAQMLMLVAMARMLMHPVPVYVSQQIELAQAPPIQTAVKNLICKDYIGFPVFFWYSARYRTVAHLGWYIEDTNRSKETW